MDFYYICIVIKVDFFRGIYKDYYMKGFNVKGVTVL